MLAVCPITSLPAFRNGGAKGGVPLCACIIRIIAEVSQLDFFSTEIALEHDGRYFVVDYVNGRTREIALPIDLRATPFQIAVWRELCAIPWGATRSYGEIARRLGRPGAARAVGLANGANPLAIIIPCHRAIGADGSMTGYRWGVEYKRRLLDHEFFSVTDARVFH